VLPGHGGHVTVPPQPSPMMPHVPTGHVVAGLQSDWQVPFTHA
jgi:hypothetical protein